MPKTTSPLQVRTARRHNPLSEEYSPTLPHKIQTKKRKVDKDVNEDGEAYVDAKSSRKILDIGQKLVDEDQEDRAKLRLPQSNPAFDFSARLEEENVEEDIYEDDGDAWGDDLDDPEEEEANPEDLDVFNRFNPSQEFNPSFDHPSARASESEGGGTNLADLILAKIAEHESGAPDGLAVRGGGVPEDAIELPAKVVEVYNQVGLLLSRYKSGKLPKAFKILPTVPQWEDLLAVTRPDSWTPNAMYAATRIFVSAKPAIVQVFLNDILLPRVREDIYETHKLNIHLYNSLKKALYKPAAFFKGLLFPMISDACTQREAHIVASVLARVSVPVLHSAAALHRLCDISAEQMSTDADSAGPANICIKVLLEKKYALPYKVLDALVFHFLRFRSTNSAAGEAASSKLPVIWHQCLLMFAQRYKNDITEDQREALLDLLLERGHKDIGPEVRRELLEGRGRGVPLPPEAGIDGDDTMMIDK